MKQANERRSSFHAKKVDILYNNMQYSVMELQKQVSRFLMTYNLPAKMTGYKYLKESLVHFIESPDVLTNKVLFAYISERHNTPIANIERCIRTLIDKTWEDLMHAGLFQDRPTPRQFITTCAEHITLNTSTRPKMTSVYDILLTNS